MAFTIGTATFTNGSAAVSNVNLSSGNTGYFSSGTRVVVGVDPVLKEVEAIAAPSAGNFTLRNTWDLPTGTYPFIANMTSEGLRDAVQKIRNLTSEFSALTRLYDTVQDGLDATSDTEYFNVVGSGGVFATLYQNDAGSATLINEMPTADAVETAETNAANSAAAALVSENNAATSESNAATSAGEALASENKAQEWAENPEDVEVEPNAYSALHWAAKAEGFATSINPTVAPTPDTAVQRTSTGAVRGADAQNADELVALGQIPDDVADLYAKNNILGTVSQSGGVPTGAIIERGSNSNGEYIKYADGTIKQWYDYESTDKDINNPDTGTGYASNNIILSPPAAQVTLANAIAIRTGGDDFFVRSCGANGGTSTSTSVLILASINAQTNITTRVRVEWIGRWY